MSDNTLDKNYQPSEIEQTIYKKWEDNGWFSPSGEGEPYCIMIPPPNVTGSLHMGHAFQDTIMDALTRYHRMSGKNTLWQPGTDHAGIATQMVVERRLNAEGKTRHDLGREEFVKQIWQWKEHSGGTITRQLRRMGASPDWSRERFTMDEGLSHAVNEVFVQLYKEGLIYRGKRLVNWDPVLHTAVSDLEVVSTEENGHLWHMRYPLSSGAGHLVVATTRPETMLGDAAVAVHPDDERYKKLIGQTVKLPLTDREIPIIADDYVDPEFGTGCVKITPAHDFNDYAIGQRHDLPLINIFTPDAKIKDSPLDDFDFGHKPVDSNGVQLADRELVGSAVVESIPIKYQGMDRFEAREQIVQDLDSQNLLEKIDDHKLMVPRSDRSHSIIEPYLTDQWYVKVAPLAAPAIKAVEKGDIKFVPENWSKTYFEWMNNIEDWCISRQIWWGHRIPAWFDKEGNFYVGHNETEVRKENNLSEDIQLKQDDDVLDTWFSSALWPFSTLGWPDSMEDVNTFYPTSVLVTGFDIIFFWVARMIMMGLKFTGKVPFHEVYIHGLVRDSHGQKMSKSKGNVLDPIDLIDGIELETLVKKRISGLMQPKMAKVIEKHTRQDFPDGIPAFGTDALRFTFASLASTGRNINFDLARVEGYRNFCNKLWNAARYVLMNTEGQDCGQRNDDMIELNAADRWIISRLQQVEMTVARSIKDYRLDRMSQTLYSFTWDEYCSWYLELSKVVLNDPDASLESLRGTRHTLVRVLETLLRLLHPLIPFITEKIWQRVAPLADKQGETIMLQPYPVANEKKIDKSAIAETEWLQAVITGIRNIRGEMNIAPGKPLPVFFQNLNQQDTDILAANNNKLKTLARIEEITCLSNDETSPDAATALVGDLKVLVPFGAFIDQGEEIKRLHKEMEKIEKDLARSTGKLSNANFVDKAPAAVVEKERARVTEMEQALASLGEQLQKIEAL
ncbi:MAG: valine--tRNA ligase [Gammaproteobacteria bacterium]|nr:valine--tRNA ligase [Gammaproteobacteria bacterium]